MINTVGTFSAIWLVLWILLSILFVVLYPLVRPRLFALHPRYGSALLLAYWMGPFLASLFSTLFLFMPTVEALLVNTHCHSDCQSHVPLIDSVGLAWFGFAVGSIVVVSLLLQFSSTMHRSLQLRNQFNFLGKPKGEYYAISSSCPLVFTLGWWQPRIYVSDGLLKSCNERDLSIILQHEHAHRERRDNLRLLLARLCSAILSGPLARRLMTDLQLMTEQACDFRAAEKHGHIAVAETLLKIKRLLLEQPVTVPFSALAFAEREVETRIIALLKAGTRIAPSRWQMGALGTLAVVCLLLLISPLHHGSEWVITFLTDTTPHSH
ncbi:MAG: M56 family metallopeptidase [Gammaproteobacteria bacterium]|nr:M56 family metallopeptidase [Gammaproteobacteria bacterium]MDP2140798.1 M56 family metallopeptidase [Gammaproteobacteria bacterium]MDP2347544.1 M56 family metallopeptidase [Gammaproteobacteria bacterium]